MSSPSQYEFMKRELLLSLNLDITNLVEPKAFDRFYAFSDAVKDE